MSYCYALFCNFTIFLSIVFSASIFATAEEYDFGDAIDDGNNTTPSTLLTNDGARHKYIPGGTVTDVVVNSNLLPAVDGITWTYENMPNNSNANGANKNDMLVINNNLLAQGASYSGGDGYDRLVLGHDQSYYIVVSQGTHAWRVTWPNNKYLNLNNVEEILFGNVTNQVESPVYLGTIKPDTEAGNYQSLTADLDDTNNGSHSSGSNDEDAYQNTTHSIPTDSFSLSVPCNDHDGTQDLGATVYAWVDFNSNQQFEAIEYALADCVDNNDSSNGSAALSWTGLSGVTNGDQLLRLRITTDTLPVDDGATAWDERATGAANDGEVEDHILTIIDVPTIDEDEGDPSLLDFGDAPNTYGTDDASNGAKHEISANLYIGATLPDDETDGQPTANADGDDVNGDDEDTLTLPVLSPSMKTWSLDVPVTNTTGSPATLYAWVDHDLDGQFQADEMASVTVSNGTNNANVTLNWTNLSGSDGGDVGDSVIRLRLTSDDLDVTQSDNAATTNVDERALGMASDGEVEDHHHKVTFHLLITQGISGKDHKIGVSGSSGNDIYAIFEAKFGVGYVTHDEVAPIQDLTTEFTLTDYQTILFKHFKNAAGTPEYDTSDEMDALIAYRNQGGILQVTTEGGRLADNYEYIHSYIVNRMGYPGAITNAYNAYSGPSNMTRLHTPTASAGGLAVQNTITTSGTMASLRGIDHRSILYATTAVSDSCSNIDAVVWLIPYNPTSTGGYAFPKSQVGPYLATSERVHYFTWHYGVSNSVNYQEFANFAYDYYEDSAAFNARNNWLNDPNNLNSTCPTTELDFGDAPDTNAAQLMNNYSTAYQFNGPHHTNNGDVYIGTSPTLETDAYVSTMADGDVDDGVTLPPAFSGENTYTVTVNATNNKSTPANLVAWFDFNRNGQFEVSEGISQVVSPNTTSQNYPLTFNLTGSLVNNTTYYARFRITTDAIDTSSELGAASDGEVEDYTIMVVQSGIFDGGDAPESYKTTFAVGGPYHEKSTTLYLGSNNVDVETAVASALADGDDNSVNNDEDGLSVITINAGMTTASITAQVFNNTGANAQLVVWVDWDKSGTFEASEAQEQNSLSSNNTLTDITLNWAGLTPITGGNYFIRARLMPSADGVTTSDIGGYASDGEVEDHLYIVTDTDYGDAPTSYGSASHFLNSETVQLGATIDYDAGNWGDGTDNNANATDDDTVDDPTGGVDDEDGIASLPDVDVATDTSYTLAVDVNNSHPTNTATLHVWFDSDGNGSFDVDEYQTATIPANTGATTENITWNGLTGLSTGIRYVRARITTDTLTTGATGSAPDTRATGLASDGEVEDYPVSFTYEHPSIVDPSTTDTDNDGVMDDIDVDDDNDGILDVDEGLMCGAPSIDDIECADVQDYNWINWTTINAAANTAEGTLNLNGEIINVNYSGSAENIYNHNFFSDSNEYCPAASGITFLRTLNAATHQFTFSKPIINPIFQVWSLGSGGTGVPYNFQQDVKILKQNGNLSQSGNVITGFEGDGSILGEGVLSQINWTGTYENWTGITIAARDYQELNGSGDPICSTVDTDNDSIPDHLDLDSDNDGIPDNIEAQTTAGYIVPNNDLSADYTANNGLNTAYLTTNGLTPNNNDSTDDPDWRDTDSDNTENNDTTEAGLTLSGVDTNFDGMDDAILPPPSPTVIWQSGIVNSSTGTIMTSTNVLLNYYPSHNGVEMDWRTSLTPDFGDAPLPYKSASHKTSLAVEQTYLGTVLPDFDTASWGDGVDTNGNATDDDTVGDPAGGIDDEDGVLLPNLLLSSTSYSINAVATNTLAPDSYLYAWIDWDNNNKFDKDEFIDGGVITVVNGTLQQPQVLLWSTLPTLVDGNAYYLRVRITTEALADTVTGSTEDPRSFGEVSDGEVEDYRIMVSLLDFGDAPDIDAGTGVGDYQTTLIDGGAAHKKADTDSDNQIDITLGTNWDDDNGSLQGFPANADDLDETTNDEDGVTLSSTMEPPGGSFDLDIVITKDPQSTLNGLQLYAWIDWNRDGDWDDTGEQVINNPTATAGSSSTPINVIGGAELGYTYIRVRACSADTSCNTPIGEADDGEVEDHQFMISDLNLVNVCDQLYVTESADGGNNYTYSAVTPVQPLTFEFNAIQNNVSYFRLNALALDRNTGMMYGTYNSNGYTEVMMTDTTGTSFSSRGRIFSDGNYSISALSGGTANFSTGTALPATIGTLFFQRGPVNMGTMSRDGTKYYVASSVWDSLIIIDLPSMTFSVKQLPAQLVGGAPNGALRIGPDWAVSEVDGLIYAVDLTGNGNIGTETEPTTPTLYTYNPDTNAVTTTPLNFNGAKAPNFATGAVATDDINHLYAFTLAGDHDSTGDGYYDINNVVGMYRINLITAEASFVIPSTIPSVNFHDAAGCIASVDKGDAPDTYGQVGHRNDDVDKSGAPDLILGTRWDPDLHDFYSNDATGDDRTGEDDEDGITMPADIIVATSTTIPVSVTGGNGFLSAFVDLNNNGVFTDPGERVLDDLAVSAGNNNVALTLSAGPTGGFDGLTFIRFRLCTVSDLCDTPTGTVANGEVEDYQFNLINQIVITGTVFEDNGYLGGTAHDGFINGSEKGLGNFTVELVYNGTGITGYNNGDVINTKITTGKGDYRFVVPVTFAGEPLLIRVVPQSRWIDISEGDVTSMPQVTNTSITDSEMSIIAQAGDSLTGLDFGKVSVPTLEPDNYTETEPGVPVVFSHKFNVNTAGDVSFSIVNPQASPLNNSWNQILYLDDNCNGELDVGVDGPVTNPIAVSANGTTQVCVLVKVIVPENVPLHAVYNYQLNADMVFSSSTVTRQLSDVDTVKVSFNGAGELEIEKTVKNITQADGESRSNQALPGDVLEYKVYFINNGSGPIDTVRIYDAVPEYSQLSQIISCTSPATLLPSSITACSIITADGANTMGYEGGIEWQFGGTLLPAERGYVTYRVTVK
ncbi:GEVED domain-containing protein [Photobacterium kishitanii]|uniref:GEVED domain-containing protein n=1 Tax=Photobacterium kishitanii TaxID=318456 RepID=UPI0004318950|nr:GEVED domain-containing protein [Photobacterium kishitanii]CEO41782.1 exported hypothetical protein [Photobacterium kishitanii]